MTTTMSMSTRRQRIDELVRQDPLVRERASEFNDAQRAINAWHLRNAPTAHATMKQLDELNELLTYSEFCLENLKCAKRRAYKQVNAQYPRIWDTSCPDPFTTDAQDEKEPGGETEEMATTPANNDTVAVIPVDKIMEILEREQATDEVTINICEAWGLNVESQRERLSAVQEIRAQFQRLIDEAKEPHNA